MAANITTDFRVLLSLAHALGQAEKKGDSSEIAQAKAEHDAYKELCLKADSMNLGLARKSL